MPSATTTELESSALTVSSSNRNAEIESLKYVLEVYRLIFNIRVLTERFPNFRRIRVFPPESTHLKGPTMYKLHDMCTMPNCYKLATGLSSTDQCHQADFDRSTWDLLKQAYLKLHQCDFALEGMIQPIRDKLKETGAKVEWLLVLPRAKILLQMCYDDTEPPHSVFEITSSMGQEYIVDFTIEQYGHSPDDWFTTKEDYLARFTEGGIWIVAPPSHQTAGKQSKEDLEHLLKLELMCWDLDWKILDGMEREERLQFVYEAAFDAFENDCEVESDFNSEAGSGNCWISH
jgi:hypothetical protein